MDTNRLKRFATEARNILVQGVAHRFTALGFQPDGTVTEEPLQQGGGATFMGDTVSQDFFYKWQSLRTAVRQHGIKEVAEEAAYTWFNRLMAIRIMVKNGLMAPILQYEAEGVHVPLLVSEARQGRLPEMSSDEQRRLTDLLDDDSKTAEQFRILIVALCHTVPVINRCFGHISDYTELLLPTNILAEGGFIDMMNETEFIAEEDYRSPELIGWLYQFYIAEKKDDVFASFKKGKKAEAEDIPAATQIFTPNWIVKYMVQNTIGRIYLSLTPDPSPTGEGSDYLAKQLNWKYLVGGDASLRHNTHDANGAATQGCVASCNDLTELKVADLACGSGHILNEAFDLLYDLYILEGYSRRAAVENIFNYNLTGVDIDTRAKQLAQFALLLKACQKDSSFADAHVMPRVLDMPKPYDPEETCISLDSACLKFIGGYENVVAEELRYCIEDMYDADTLGSIMRLEMDEDCLAMVRHYYEEWTEGGTDDCPDYIRALLPAVELILVLNEKYSALVMNPPYMGSGNMNKVLSDYVKDHYPDAKADLFSVFMQVAVDRLADGGKYGMINMHSWMFLSSFEKLRRDLLDNYHIDSLLHLGPRTFDELSGEVVQNVAFVVTKACNASVSMLQTVSPNVTNWQFEASKPSVRMSQTGTYYRLVDGKNCGDKERMFLEAQANHTPKVYYPDVEQKNFEKIPGCPIGYWVSENYLRIFQSKKSVIDAHPVKKGIDTGKNERFVRYWHEVSEKNLSLTQYNRKWFTYIKGGEFRRWYGNTELVVNWEDDGREIKMFKGSTIRNQAFMKKEAVTWTLLSSKAGISSRYVLSNSMFDNNGSSAFPSDNKEYLLAFLNSKVANQCLAIINPTLAFQVGNIASLPFIESSVDSITTLGRQNISIAKLDWDSHETSWDFEANPLVAMVGGAAFLPHNDDDSERHNDVVRQECRTSYRIEDLVRKFEDQWEQRFHQLHENEEELNRQFIEIYGLQDELTPDVPLDEITILQQGEISIE